MSPAVFLKTSWLLLCVLLSVLAQALAICSDGENRIQTCSNNTWCPLFSVLDSRQRTGPRTRSSKCRKVCKDTCEDLCEDARRHRECSHGECSCQADEVTPVITTVTHSVTVTFRTPIQSTLPNLGSNRGALTHTVSMATLGVVTGIFLLSLVMVIAGWVWTCVRMRSSNSLAAAQNGTAKPDQSSRDADIKTERNQVYGYMNRHRENETETDNVYENL